MTASSVTSMTVSETDAQLCGSDYRFASQIVLVWQFRNRLELVPEFKSIMQERRQEKREYFAKLWENSLSIRFLYDAFLSMPKSGEASRLAAFIESLERVPSIKASDISVRPILTQENVVDLMLMLELYVPYHCAQTLSRSKLFLCLHTFQFYQHSLGSPIGTSPLTAHLRQQKGLKKGDGTHLRLAYEPVTRGIYCLETNRVEYNPFLLAVSDMEASALTKAIDDIKAVAFNGVSVSKILPFAVPALWPQPFPDMAPVAQHFQNLPCTAGLRGLRNLGNSCYMNVVLQAFASSVVLKSMFLADYHPHSSCSTKNCTACELDKLIVSLHCGETTPYSPTSFLMNLWLCSPHLATAAEHDAHEFYVSVLSSLHENIAHAESDHSAPGSCSCPAHSVFYGTEVSHITCTICRNETQKEETFGNICLSLKGVSLGSLPSSLVAAPALYSSPESFDASASKRRKTDSIPTGKVGRPRKNAAPSASLAAPSGAELNPATLTQQTDADEAGDSKTAAAGDAGASSGKTTGLSIVECLQRYTAPEKLAFSCSNCQKSTPATKHYSFKQLPRVLTIQLKRFEHTVKTTRKINTFVHFPSRLDMSPYTTYAVKCRRNPAEVSSSLSSTASLVSSQPATPITPLSPSITKAEPSDPGFYYNLFCVIHHIGDLESGHYIAFVKSRDQWFQIDDDNITCVDIKLALSSTAYMLFYSREYSSIQVPVPQV